jgi:hypothetical protein
MFPFDSDVFIPMMVFAIPIVAIAGGIMAGIVRILGQQRVVELAQRERIAAIERGIDPSRLPAIPSLSMGDDFGVVGMTPRQSMLRRSSGLMIGGLVTLGVGLGLGIMLYLLNDTRDENVWAVGLIPGFVGIALLLSSWLVRRSADQDDAAPAPPPRTHAQ